VRISLWAATLLALTASAGAAEQRWWKGNLHTHSHWSDGDDYPEMIAEWYKTNGYHFLALSDHNVVLEGQKWISITNSKGGQAAFDRYLERFGDDWVETRTMLRVQQVRLKTLKEFRGLLEKRNEFLMIPSEEISDNFRKRPIHLNATNLRKLIKPQEGSSVLDVLQRNVDAVLDQREQSRQPMFPHISHPNFGWALSVEDLMRVKGNRFYEVYNGHPAVHNEGNEFYMSTERMWDIALAFRLTGRANRPGEPRLGVLYGLAVDDSHNYHQWATNRVNPGRGWVMVRAPRLRPNAIIAAMEAGDFYASTGVRLKDVRREHKQLAVEIAAESGVTYKVQFIGTRRGFDPTSRPGVAVKTNAIPASRIYSPQIGETLAEVEGASAAYTLDGDELYVRAKILSSKAKRNGYRGDEMEVAWTQPLVALEAPVTAGE
jgi:hypothetical protein